MGGSLAGARGGQGTPGGGAGSPARAAEGVSGSGWRPAVRAGLRAAALGEAHGDCVLERLAAQGRDARAPPHVAAVRRAAELGRAGDVAGAGEGGGHHAGEGGLVEVRLQPRAVGARQAVGQAHGVGRWPCSQAALGQRLRHSLLAAERGRQRQLGHAGHGGRRPAGVVGVERAQAVTHGGGGGSSGRRELGQARRGQQRAWCAEHVGGLLALLPLGAPILEPNLQRAGWERQDPVRLATSVGDRVPGARLLTVTRPLAESVLRARHAPMPSASSGFSASAERRTPLCRHQAQTPAALSSRGAHWRRTHRASTTRHTTLCSVQHLLHSGIICALYRCTSLQAGMCQGSTHRCTNEDKHEYPCGLIACLIALMGYRIFRNTGNLEIDERPRMT